MTMLRRCASIATVAPPNVAGPLSVTVAVAVAPLAMAGGTIE
ncbi:MAG: hypothetical protein WA208_15885 [Thermoanaerobaculia bacterium]